MLVYLKDERMKRITIYGSALATFLMVSLAFIQPVTAQSSGLTESLDNVEDIKGLSYDENFQGYSELILSYLELKSILEEYLDGNILYNSTLLAEDSDLNIVDEQDIISLDEVGSLIKWYPGQIIGLIIKAIMQVIAFVVNCFAAVIGGILLVLGLIAAAILKAIDDFIKGITN